MRVLALLVAVLVTAAPASALHSLPTDATYNVAAVQYAPHYVFSWYPDAPSLTVGLNLDAIPKHVANASAHGADVVVFPEGATGYFQANLNGSRLDMRAYCDELPSVTNGFPVHIPCVDSTAGRQAKAFSCAAADNKVILAVNMCEVQLCAAGTSTTADGVCPDDGMYLWDTTAVFSETGQLLAKYRKYNLFSGDFLLNRQPAPVPTFFDTTLGVRFGLFICFDLIYQDPAVNLVKEHGITDILFSTYWINQNIFTATMVQQAYSRAQGVNFVGSNVGICPKNCGGGAYHKGDPLGLFFTVQDTLGTQTVHATVPKIQHTLPPASQQPTAVYAARIPGPEDTPGVTNFDCLFGPNSCALFIPATTRAGTLRVEGASGLRCTATFAVAEATNATESWVLQALDHHGAVPDSPSVRNETSCAFLRCTPRTDHLGRTYCHVAQNFVASATRFSALTITSSGLHPDTEPFPMYARGRANIAPASAAEFTRLNSTAVRWELTPPGVRLRGASAPPGVRLRGASGAPSRPGTTRTSSSDHDVDSLSDNMFIFAIQGFRSPLVVR